VKEKRISVLKMCFSVCLFCIIFLEIFIRTHKCRSFAQLQDNAFLASGPRKNCYIQDTSDKYLIKVLRQIMEESSTVKEFENLPKSNLLQTLYPNLIPTVSILNERIYIKLLHRFVHNFKTLNLGKKRKICSSNICAQYKMWFLLSK
jgi:hypothetical protein